MYSDYEESFYYNKPSSVSAGVAGEAVGLGLGLGVGLISTILSGLLFLIGRIDILSSHVVIDRAGNPLKHMERIHNWNSIWKVLIYIRNVRIIHI